MHLCPVRKLQTRSEPSLLCYKIPVLCCCFPCKNFVKNHPAGPENKIFPFTDRIMNPAISISQPALRENNFWPSEDSAFRPGQASPTVFPGFMGTAQKKAGSFFGGRCRRDRNTTVFIGSEFIFPLQKCSLIKKEEPLTIKSGAPSFRQKARRHDPSFTDSIRDEWPAHRGESYRKTGFSAR